MPSDYSTDSAINQPLALSGYNVGGTLTYKYKLVGASRYALAHPALSSWHVSLCSMEGNEDVLDRWTYPDKESAQAAVDAWPMDAEDSYEPTGWVRHPKTGRRRTDGDPLKEYIAW